MGATVHMFYETSNRTNNIPGRLGLEAPFLGHVHPSGICLTHVRAEAVRQWALDPAPGWGPGRGTPRGGELVLGKQHRQLRPEEVHLRLGQIEKESPLFLGPKALGQAACCSWW